MSEAKLREEQLDEARIARGVAIALPIVTITGAVGVGFLMGPATGILVMAAGLLLGVIAILWGSIRILSGDAPLSPDLEELDMRAQGNDPLLSRKKMLLRALKDLDNERAIGKLETDDYEQIAAQYRTDLKAVLNQMDAAIAPNRVLAEEAARKFLERMKRVETEDEESSPDVAETAKKKSEPKESRVTCPKCDAKNEPDAKFCKECATKLLPDTSVADPTEVSDA